MTQISQGVYESSTGDLCSADGSILVPADKRMATEVYSRVVGYLRPVRQWNKGKKAEWAQRVDFRAPKIEGAEPTDEHDS